MSCQKCEEVQERGDVAYIRIDKANVGLIGCDEHLSILLSTLKAGRESGKVIEVNIRPVRVLADPENRKYYETN